MYSFVLHGTLLLRLSLVDRWTFVTDIFLISSYHFRTRFNSAFLKFPMVSSVSFFFVSLLKDRTFVLCSSLRYISHYFYSFEYTTHPFDSCFISSSLSVVYNIFRDFRRIFVFLSSVFLAELSAM